MYSEKMNFSNPVPISVSEQWLPLVTYSVRAGFPSPAEDFCAQRLELNTMLVKHPETTFMVRVRGDSMVNAGIFDNDILVVDKLVRPQHNDVVVAIVDGEFTCKRYCCLNGKVILRAENPTYPDIRLREDQIMEIWGVVTNAIKQFRKL
jgi:DNA polymerase V